MQSSANCCVGSTMRSAAPSPSPTISCDGDLPRLDSDQLLRILLRSIPSAQHRPELGRRVRDLSEDGSEDELLPQPAPDCGSLDDTSTHVQYSGLPDTSIDASAPQDVPTRLNTVLSIFAVPPAELTLEPHIPVNDDFETVVDLTDDDADGLRENHQTDAADSFMNGEHDDEIEVEYMLIAAKCITSPDQCHRIHDESQSKTSRRPYKRRARRTKANRTPPVLKAPPEIKRRRRQVIAAAKPKRKRRGVPGFV